MGWAGWGARGWGGPGWGARFARAKQGPMFKPRAPTRRPVAVRRRRSCCTPATKRRRRRARSEGRAWRTPGCCSRCSCLPRSRSSSMFSDRRSPALMCSHGALQPCCTLGLRGPEAQGCLLRAGLRYCALHAPYACQYQAHAESTCRVRAAQALSRLTHLPLITIYLAAGLLSQLFMPGSLHKPLHDVLQPVHDAALGCITLAAGSTVSREWLARRLGRAPVRTPPRTAWHARLELHLELDAPTHAHPPTPTRPPRREQAASSCSTSCAPTRARSGASR